MLSKKHVQLTLVETPWVHRKGSISNVSRAKQAQAVDNPHDHKSTTAPEQRKQETS